jgi:hypothetical protein
MLALGRPIKDLTDEPSRKAPVPWRLCTMKNLGLNRVVALGLVAFGAVFGIACTVTTGGDVDDGGFEGDTPDGSVTRTDSGTTTSDAAAPNSCNLCNFQNCEAQTALCNSEAECRALKACLTACTDKACKDKCFVDHAAGEGAYWGQFLCNQAAMCNSGPCGSQCTGVFNDAYCSATRPTPPVNDAGAGSDAAPVTPDGSAVDACNTCIDASCATQKGACAAGSDCEKFSSCVGGCGDSDAACFAKCGTDNPTGAQASTALATCTTEKCATACGL